MLTELVAEADGAYRHDPRRAVALAVLLARKTRTISLAKYLAGKLRNTFPNTEIFYRLEVLFARETGALDEAAVVLGEAIRRFGDQWWILSKVALLAKARGDYADAKQAAAALRNRFPERSLGYRLEVLSAGETGRLDEAASILIEAMRRFPGEDLPIVETIDMATREGRRDLALRLAAELREHAPKDPFGYSVAVTLLAEMNLLDHAEAIASEAATRFPNDTWPALQCARIARARSDRRRSLQLVQSINKSDSGAGFRGREPGRVVVMLGMHRAGTSLCARISRALGVALGGPLLAPNWANPDGYQEHGAILRTHETLLASAGADWDTPRSVRPLPVDFWISGAVTQAVDALKSIVEAEMAAAAPGCWGFKDPRTARFIPLWRRVFRELGVRPVWILAVRDPNAVARSLQVRNGMEWGVAQLLWLEHYLDAVRHLGPEIAYVAHYERWSSAAHEQAGELAAVIGGTALASVADAARLVRPSRARSCIEPGAEGGPGAEGLKLAYQFHNALTQVGPDLARLQIEAESTVGRLETEGQRILSDHGNIV